MSSKIRAPSFGSQTYWEHRFTKNTAPFDWLSTPCALDPFIKEALQDVGEVNPQILHVGCGSSMLSHHLKTHVRSAQQIHNVDYSTVVIETERQREIATSRASEKQGNGDAPMRWDVVDLLDYTSVAKTCACHPYSVIVDKSTCDAVSCADDVVCPLPYALATRETTAAEMRSEAEPKQVRVQPLYVLAIHLALVTEPGARWVALSFSSERYSFLEEKTARVEEDDTADTGIPDPRLFWTVVVKHPIEAEQQEDSNGNGVTHRPKLYHWVYLLQRTPVPLVIRSA
ncbi:hypothetical protein ST47_g10423 [Ascochyta rabiei]|uniref:Uncharacterized protein n=1 Tax=Didymella rabiei TaxID=5454 RepID=A0A162VH25_DIDRA|nr:hypothetical protein ST47_g10423 [Ascochyta rabiei]